MLIVNVMHLDYFVHALNRTLVEISGANLIEFFRKFSVGKMKGSFIAGDKDDILVILSFLLNDAVHVFIHVGSDKNVDPAIFGGFRVFLGLKIVFGDSYATEFFDFFNFLLVDFASKGVVESIQCFNIGVIVVDVLSI